MKGSLSYRIAFIVLLALALAQFACTAGSQAATAAPQEASTSAPQAEQPSAAPATSGAKSGHGTIEEAKVMLQKAVEHYNAVGRKQALADFTGKVAPFYDRDLYVACMGSNHIITANGGFPNLVGVSADSEMTADGKPLGAETWANASTTTVNSVHYLWTDPVDGHTEPKTFFYEKVGSDVCGVGVYTP